MAKLYKLAVIFLSDMSMDSDGIMCENKVMGHNKPEITESHIEQIRQLIDTNPSWTRSALSRKLCEMWDWKSSVGQIKDISCRDLLRSLDRKGLICLPAARQTTRAPGLGADKIKHVEHDATAVEVNLRDIVPIRTKIITSAEEVRLFKAYVHQYHYLGFDRSVGENMKYFVCSNNGTILACLMFGSAAWSCADRDYYIGWNKGHRAKNLMFMTANTR